VVILVIFLSIGGAVGVLYWRNDRFREFVHEKIDAVRGRRGAPTYSIVNADEDEGGI